MTPVSSLVVFRFETIRAVSARRTAVRVARHLLASWLQAQYQTDSYQDGMSIDDGGARFFGRSRRPA
jgi:hypothetical protein